MLSDRISQRTLAYVRTLNEGQIADLEALLQRDHAFLLFTRRGHRFFAEAVVLVKRERAEAVREEDRSG